MIQNSKLLTLQRSTSVNGFEQFCVNLYNERLEWYYQQKVLRELQWEYQKEDISGVDLQVTIYHLKFNFLNSKKWKLESTKARLQRSFLNSQIKFEVLKPSDLKVMENTMSEPIKKFLMSLRLNLKKKLQIAVCLLV